MQMPDEIFVENLEATMGGLTTRDAHRLAERLREDLGGDLVNLVAEAWLAGATATRNIALGRRCCRICGCTQEQACLEEDGFGCAWVEPDLCSACDVIPPVTPARVAEAHL